MTSEVFIKNSLVFDVLVPEIQDCIIKILLRLLAVPRVSRSGKDGLAFGMKWEAATVKYTFVCVHVNYLTQEAL